MEYGVNELQQVSWIDRKYNARVASGTRLSLECGVNENTT